MSVAVTVWEPIVLSVTLTVRVPAAKAPLAGSVALESLDVITTVWVLLTRFQLASTELTVKLYGVPAARAEGVPVLPVAVPAVAVSPGASNCNFTNAPALTVTAGLVLAVLLASVTSVAVSVRLPAVFKVTLKLFVPTTKAVLAGRTALASEEVIPTVSVTAVVGFQLASTALTVTFKGVPEVCAVGVPVLPVLLPGAAVSPGASSCSFTKAPALTVMDGLVLALLLPSVTSVAVKVCEPAVLNVTLRVFVPETKAASAGRVALASVEVISTVSLTALTTFQKLSTALTVMLKAVAAVLEVGVPLLPVALPGAAVSPGTSNWSFAKAAGLTTMLPEVAVVRPVAVKFSVIVLATVWDRFAKVAIPLTAVAVKVPCRVPLPALRATVITVLLSLVRRLPLASSMRMTGCCARTTPAVAAAEGCV